MGLLLIYLLSISKLIDSRHWWEWIQHGLVQLRFIAQFCKVAVDLVLVLSQASFIRLELSR